METTSMSRIRSIKPEHAHDEKLGRVSREARYLYVLLGPIACDDEGRFRAHPSLLRSELFPYDDGLTGATVAGWLAELVEHGKVILYTHDGCQYGWLPDWRNEQRIDKPSPSILPSPDDPESSWRDPGAFAERSATARIPLATEGKGVEGSGVDISLGKPSSPTIKAEVVEVFKVWQAATGHHRAVLDGKRRRCIEAAIKSHGELDASDACRGWVNDPWPERKSQNDVTKLLGDAARIEKFRDLWRNGPPPPLADAKTRAYLAAKADRERRLAAETGGPMPTNVIDMVPA